MARANVVCVQVLLPRGVSISNSGSARASADCQMTALACSRYTLMNRGTARVGRVRPLVGGFP